MGIRFKVEGGVGIDKFSWGHNDKNDSNVIRTQDMTRVCSSNWFPPSRPSQHLKLSLSRTTSFCFY